MSNNNHKRRWDPSLFSVFFLVFGLIVLISGVYFLINDITGTGFKMDRYRGTYGEGNMNGGALIIGGILIFGFGLITSINKKE